MSKRSLPPLSDEELENICNIAEEAARKYVMSRVPKEMISDLTISVDVEEKSKALNVDVDVEVKLSPLYRKVNVKEIAEGSVDAAFRAVEKYLSKFRSQQ
ncbi:DUF3194 domain-containing protein [Candidatus Bathyarchaeota archaeon]|nr:DUF3194 domain-containing protein [Candidatus Bathyarchaeota archaeon]